MPMNPLVLQQPMSQEKNQKTNGPPAYASGRCVVPARRGAKPTARRSYSRSRRLYTSLTFFSGRLRTGLPVAAWIALRTAGDTTEMVGSPTPPQNL